MKSATFALLAVLVGTAPALAETGAERAACTPDVMRLCAAQIPNAGAITLCLREKRVSLSGACRTVVDRSDRPAREIANRR
ncbi:hypothetical protein SAMN02799636_01485 [Methylobacterium sp. 275MFSha3.1]|uniref:hypothetical protein n=1 Tax=Methylobacterium sp. 275MFSha3.1 TaxID=1502746 RepID=UPI0008A7537A|nr:hypothetical protein [Methylobacterium sp. 275MFSha3.1]SEH33993.1 hypothetical protein SAMN02799636_01485 [Methylobacterium sp. 275MFSha3.1]